MALVIAALLTGFASGCGGSGETSASERTPGWGAVVKCLRAHQVAISALPHPGIPEDSQNDFPPFSFSKAPGGWIVAALGQEQKLYIMFYSTPLEVERVVQGGAEIAFKEIKTRSNVLYGYKFEPEETELQLAANCIESVP